MPLFWFPYAVNRTGARVIGCLTMITAIFGIIFRNEREMEFVIAGMTLDTIARFIWGGNASIFGVISQIICHYLPIRLTPGAPKQFATFCSFFFSGTATILFFAANSPIAASVVLGMLAMAAAMEFFIDFCAGCLFFSLGIRFGLIPAEESAKCDRTLEETEKRIFEKTRFKTDEKKSDEKVYQYETGTPEDPERIGQSISKLDVKYRGANDDIRNADFHPIRHQHVMDAAAILGVCGLAMVWKVAAIFDSDIPDGIWIAIAIMASIWFGFFTIFYLLKLAFYPKKVYKEFWHPAKHSAFSAVPLILLIFAFLAIDESNDTSRVLFWIAAPFSMFLCCFAVAFWTAYPQNFSAMFNPTWLMPTVGPLLAAIVAPFIEDEDLEEAAYLWFAFPLFLWFILRVVSFHRLSFARSLKDKQRESILFFIVPPALVFAAYLSLNGRLFSGELDFFSRVFVYITFGETLVAVFLYVPWGHLGYSYPFHRTSWFATFPCDSVALVCLIYHEKVQSKGTEALLYISLAVATWITVLLTLHTFKVIAMRKWFIPIDKWAATSWIKLQHRAMEGALEKLSKLANRLSADDQDSIAEFRKQFLSFHLLYTTHAGFEEEIIFPTIAASFPSAVNESHEEHERDEETVEQLLGFVNNLEGNAATAIGSINDALPTFIQNVSDHVHTEEMHLNPIQRKYWNPALHRRTARKVFYATQFSTWKLIIPFCMRSIEGHHRRLRFCRALCYTVPEHTQTFGLWIYAGVNREIWDRLASDMPELIPKGLSGHIRYY